jgi:hypothetical protein
MRRVLGLCLPALLVLLAGCIANSSSTGDDGNRPPPAANGISPAHVTVAAGATQTFKVESGDKVSWQVNGIDGGNATVGTISSGTYTAPKLPPADGTVTITAVPESGSDSEKHSATAEIRYSNASLDGAYVFSWRGRTGNGPFGTVGRFEADGKGSIDSGREDRNAPDGVTRNLAFDGSYKVSDDGTGQAVFTSSRGRAELRFVIGKDGHAHTIRVDNGTMATGDIAPRAHAETLAVAGEHVFHINGATADNLRIATIGRFSADQKKAVDAGLLDHARGNAVTRAARFTGAWERNDNDRGSLRLSSTLGTFHYALYAASPDDIRVLRLDTGYPLTGRMRVQSVSKFDKATLTDNYVFYLLGDNGGNAVATAGLLKANGNGNISDGVFDNGGSGSIAFTGIYSIASSGRGTARFSSSSGRTDLSFYMQSKDRAVVLETDGTGRRGEFIKPQDDSFSDTSLNGPYTLAGAGTQNSTIGRVKLNGSGKVSDGSETRGDSSQAIALTGQYTLKSSGRGKLALMTNGGGEQDYILYGVAADRVLLLGASANAMSLGWLNRQWPTAQ